MINPTWLLSAMMNNMSNKGWKKLRYAAHAHTFECPVCDNLFRLVEDDIIFKPINDRLSITSNNVTYHIKCTKCGAISHMSEGMKDYAY